MSISEIQHIAPYIQKFPELVRHAKTAAGLTNEELSDLSGVPYSTVCKIQSGERDPKLYDAIAIMQALGISPYQAFAIQSDGDADAAAAQERIHELELDNAVASGDVARLEQVNGLCTERLDAVIHQRDHYRRWSIFASIFSAALSLFLIVYLLFDFRTPNFGFVLQGIPTAFAWIIILLVAVSIGGCSIAGYRALLKTAKETVRWK